jgi:GTP-binding protein
MAEHGETGEERWLRLELRLLADVGLIGVPNAGKSTLLAAVTAARPKIAPYPFTTLEPNLGVVVLDDQTEFVLADIPGLVEGASEGRGLGHEFLRHVERTRILVHLLDGASGDPLADLETINQELVAFGHGLVDKPQLVVLSKIDIAEVRQNWPSVCSTLEARSQPVMAVSGMTGEGTRAMLYRVASMLAEAPEVAPSTELPVFRLEPDGREFRVVREADGWRVSGVHVERAAAMTVWNLEEAVRRFHRVLERSGISASLEEAGVRAGDTVYIGEQELVWED